MTSQSCEFSEFQAAIESEKIYRCRKLQKALKIHTSNLSLCSSSRHSKNSVAFRGNSVFIILKPHQISIHTAPNECNEPHTFLGIFFRHKLSAQKRLIMSGDHLKNIFAYCTLSK